MTKVFVDGEHGTTGLQIIERLNGRSDITLLSIPHADRHSVEARTALLREADIAILCLPDAAARESVVLAEGAGTRFIDASTAHRVDDAWTFGFLELEPNHGSIIAAAQNVSNPGCYSTGAIALIRPIVKAGLLSADAPVTIFGVSGYTGGGKGMIAQMEDPNHADAISAPFFLYATQLHHKHVPETQKYGMLNRAPLFQPSVGRYPQGMIVQVPFHTVQLGGATRADVHKALADHYADAKFVRVVPMEESDALPRLDPTQLAGTDTMDLHVFGHDGQINLVAILDNLGKGASGACVQSLDLMIGG